MSHSQSKQFGTDQILLKQEGKELLNDLNLRISNSTSIHKKSYEKNYLEVRLMTDTIENINQTKFRISYHRLIVDQWDFSDELGIRLLNFKEQYLNLKNKQ